MDQRPKGYTPTAGYDRLLRLYDPYMRWVAREETFKRRLVQEAQVASGHRVLDLGCGTGTMTLLIKRLHSAAKVCGLDGDPKALAIARRKAEQAQAAITFDQGFSYSLPYPNASFDRVLASLLFHHLTRAHKMQTLSEVLRILKPGGTLHIVDLGKPPNSIGAYLINLIHLEEQIRDNIEGRMVTLLQDADFVGAQESRRRHRTLFASLSFCHGSKDAVQSETAAIY